MGWLRSRDLAARDVRHSISCLARVGSSCLSERCLGLLVVGHRMDYLDRCRLPIRYHGHFHRPCVSSQLRWTFFVLDEKIDRKFNRFLLYLLCGSSRSLQSSIKDQLENLGDPTLSTYLDQQQHLSQHISQHSTHQASFFPAVRKPKDAVLTTLDNDLTRKLVLKSVRATSAAQRKQAPFDWHSHCSRLRNLIRSALHLIQGLSLIIVLGTINFTALIGKRRYADSSPALNLILTSFLFLSIVAYHSVTIYRDFSTSYWQGSRNVGQMIVWCGGYWPQRNKAKPWTKATESGS